VAETLANEPRAEFMFTDEQQQLLSAVRRFAAENFDETTVRRLMESDPPFDPKAWNRLGGELGVLGLSVSEADGGVGGTLVDQAVAVEELGAALACGPIFGTVYLAIPALVAASAGPARDELLTELVEGRRTAAFAVPDRAGAVDASLVDVTATPSGDDWTLTGTVDGVVDAGAADDLLVAAIGPDGVALFAVDAAAAGVERTTQLTVDQTRPQAVVTLSAAPARLLSGPDEAERVIDHAFQVASSLLAVEQVGAAQHMLDVAVQYAKERLQFGRPIGSFQAVKHRLADVLVDRERCLSASRFAAAVYDVDPDGAAVPAAVAAAICTDAVVRTAHEAVQLHGGIGFTWEHHAHRYVRRALGDEGLFGSAHDHRLRLAELLAF